jgi:hypothetical protein
MTYLRTSIALLALVSTGVSAQLVNPHSLSSPTRGVVVFSALEQQLETAVARGNRQDIDRLLAADFEQRDAASAGSPTPRAQWLGSHAAGRDADPATFTVHDLGTVAVVSYVDHPMPSRSNRHAGRFIVDVWRNQGGNWQLQVRYQSPSKAIAQDPSRRPTGKE